MHPTSWFPALPSIPFLFVCACAAGPSPSDGAHADGGTADTDGSASDADGSSSCSPRIVAVSASTDDGNIPADVLDGDLDTRWSGEGDGAWIELRLSCAAIVDAVSIAFHRGNERRSTFSVTGSLDGTPVALLDHTTSSGTTTAMEAFPFAPTRVDLLRIVGHGNDGSTDGPEWNSYTEIRIGSLPVALETATCGDDRAEGDELCDGVDLRGVACTDPTLGFGSGTLGCATDCRTLDTSGCVGATDDLFEIIFAQDLEDTPLGPYTEADWRDDWASPPWSNHALGWGDIIDSEGAHALRVSYPAGTFSLTESGVQWYTELGSSYTELYLTYRVRFSTGFTLEDLDGKLPGLCGGGCNSGGDRPDGTDGWSARYMFKGPAEGRVGTALMFYIYHPDLPDTWGDGVEFSSPTLEANRWYEITQRIVMNTVGATDGFVEGYVDGVLRASGPSMRFRTVESLAINRIAFATFLGGSGVAPMGDEEIDFDDLIVYRYRDGVDVPRGPGTAGRSPADRTLVLPRLPH